MLKGNNLIWKSRQTTDYRENSQCCNICLSTIGCYGNINTDIRVMVTFYTFLFFIYMLPRKFKDPTLNSMPNWRDWVILGNI